MFALIVSYMPKVSMPYGIWPTREKRTPLYKLPCLKAVVKREGELEDTDAAAAATTEGETWIRVLTVSTGNMVRIWTVLPMAPHARDCKMVRGSSLEADALRYDRGLGDRVEAGLRCRMSLDGMRLERVGGERAAVRGDMAVTAMGGGGERVGLSG